MKSLAIAFLLLGSLTTLAEDMQAYLRETKSLAQSGQHQQALERMIWFHDNALREDPSIYTIRLSVALDEWKRLASFYRPAKTALIGIRDRNEARILDRGGSRLLFADLVAINRVLGKPERSLEVFETLHTTHPDRARQYWPMVKQVALQERDLILASDYISDVAAEFEPIKLDYERRKKRSAKQATTNPAILLAREEAFVEQTLPLIELAINTGEPAAAIQIQKEALELVDDPNQQELLTAGLPKIPERLPLAEDPPLPAE